jgi:hypothetical protein
MNVVPLLFDPTITLAVSPLDVPFILAMTTPLDPVSAARNKTPAVLHVNTPEPTDHEPEISSHAERSESNSSVSMTHVPQQLHPGQNAVMGNPPRE